MQDPDFTSLSGVRIVRIAVHPDLPRAGYGSRAVELLCRCASTDQLQPVFCVEGGGVSWQAGTALTACPHGKFLPHLCITSVDAMQKSRWQGSPARLPICPTLTVCPCSLRQPLHSRVYSAAVLGAGFTRGS